MEKKAFDIIINQIWGVISKQNFKKNIDNKNNIGIFIGEQFAYKVIFDKDKKSFQFFSCEVENNQCEENWQLKSLWGFNPNTDDEKQAKSIAVDFIETIEGPKKSKKKVQKKKHKDEDGNVDALFLVNRLVNIFIELKDDLQNEKASYSSFRGATFSKEKLVPAIDNFLAFDSNNDPKLKRFCKVLSDCYDTGDLDVRGIITTILLNSIEKESFKELVKPRLTEELQKAWQASERIKGKKIKPEKVKNKKFAMPNPYAKP